MATAIISNKRNKVATTPGGLPHIYDDPLEAVKVCDALNSEAARQAGCDPLHPPPTMYRVRPA